MAEMAGEDETAAVAAMLTRSVSGAAAAAGAYTRPLLSST